MVDCGVATPVYRRCSVSPSLNQSEPSESVLSIHPYLSIRRHSDPLLRCVWCASVMSVGVGVCLCLRLCACVRMCGALVGGAGEVEQLDRVGEGRAELCVRVCDNSQRGTCRSVCVILVSEGRAELERSGPKKQEKGREGEEMKGREEERGRGREGGRKRPRGKGRKRGGGSGREGKGEGARWGSKRFKAAKVTLRDVVPTMKSFSDMAGMYLHTHARTHSMRPWP